MFKEYEEKLSCRNARIVALWKWRFVFLGAFLLIVAASVLLGMTGSVMNTEAAESCGYGEQISAAGYALFRDITFRYRAEGGDWTERVPVNAGSYEVQAVSRGLAGKPRYGKTLYFSITPAPLKVKVTDADVDFGDIPKSVTADGLKYGDELGFGGFDIEYHDSTADITPVKENLRIIGKNKADVTANYTITVETKTVICNPIGATVTTADGSWVYDGKEHVAGDITADGLLTGHFVGRIKPPAIKDAGSIKNDVRFTIFDEDGNDVTVHYDIEKKLGTLTVTARPVSVTTASLSIVYDGTEHSLSNAPLGELAEGHRFAYDPQTISLKGAGKIENSVDFKVDDADGNDVTDNYTVTVKFGALEIERRPLTIHTRSENIVYDGMPHDNRQIIADNIADGESVAAFGWKSITDVGSVKNDIEYSIRGALGEDVSGEYVIKEEFGTLTVTARPVAVTTAGRSIVYDGIEHSLSNAPLGELAEGHSFVYDPQTITLKSVGKIENSVDFKIEDADGNDVEGNYTVTVKFGTLIVTALPVAVTTADFSTVYDGIEHSLSNEPLGELAEGHRFVYDPQTITLKSVGKIENSVDFKIEDADGNDVEGNYTITVKFGALEITKRPLVIKTGSATKVYDGKPLYNNNESEISVEGLADTDHINRFFGLNTLTDVGSTPNSFIRYWIYNANSVETKNNYDIDEQWGTLTVEPYVIRLQSGDVTATYDGQTHGGGEGKNLNSPLNGHVLTLGDWTRRIDAGSEPNVPHAISVKASGLDVTGNYFFDTSACGSVTISPRTIKVTTDSAVFVYDGEPKKAEGYTTQTDGLLYGHVLSPHEATEVTDITDHDGQIGYVDNIVKFNVRDTYSDMDVSDNYEIDGTWGTIRVKPPIVVRLLSLSKVYDGTELTYDPADWHLESLPVDIKAEWLSIDLAGALTDVGTLGADAVRSQSEVKLIDGDGQDLLLYNRVDFVGEPLTVLPRPLTVRSASVRMPCEGNILYGQNMPHSAWISFGTLLEGHRAVFDVTGMLEPNATASPNTVSVRIFDGDTDVTDRYDIHYEFGTLSWI